MVVEQELAGGRRGGGVEGEVGHALEHEGVAHVAEGLGHGHRRVGPAPVAVLGQVERFVGGVHVAVVVHVRPRVPDVRVERIVEPRGVGAGHLGVVREIHRPGGGTVRPGEGEASIGPS